MRNTMMTYITGKGIDLSLGDLSLGHYALNRSLEELISSYYEARAAGIELDVDTRPEELDAYYTLENYLHDMGAI
jgi:hypothetical protein